MGLPGLAIKSVGNGLVCHFLADFGADTLGFQVSFKSVNTSVHFVLCFIKFLISNFVIFLGLGKIEFKLGGFTLTLDRHVLFPILNALGKPLFHEASIALEFVDLDSAHLLLFVSVHLHIILVQLGSLSCLSNELIVVLLLMCFKINIFLGTVKFSKPLLEESVGDIVVFGFRHRDSLCGLVVAKGTSLGHDGDVSRWVDLLEHHLELVEQTEGLASLAVHNLLNSLAVELNVEGSKSGLQLFEIHHEVGGRILNREIMEVRLLVEFIQEFAEKITAGEVLLKV